MRITFLNLSLDERTGAGSFCARLIEALRECDPTIKTRVLTTFTDEGSEAEAILPVRWTGLWRYFFKIRSIIRSSDLIHALDGWPYGVIAALANIGIKKPLVITAIGTGAIQPLYDWRRPLITFAYRRANRIVAISHYTRNEILVRVPDLHIEVINHAVRAEEFSNDGGVSEKELADIDALKPYVLSVGASKPRKGFQDSLIAFKKLHAKFPELRYVIVGTSGREFLPLVKEVGIESVVVFLRGLKREKLVAIYRRAELFILLPRDEGKDVEGFGLAFLEAAAAGLPVVGAKGSGAEDAIRDRENGMLVPANDNEKAVEAMERIYTDRNLRAQFSKASQEFAREMRWDRVGEQYYQIYKNLGV